MTRQVTNNGKRMTRQQVAAALRDQIVSGVYRPGQRLPSRSMMNGKMPGGYVTIQAAVKQLEKEKFVRSRHGDGTFVAEYPPHLCHYGMLIAEADDAAFRAGSYRFLRTLVEEAQRFNRRSRGRRILTWHDPAEDVTRAGYHALVDMVQAHRLAGVIYPDAPIGLEATPLFSTPHVGRVTAATPEHQAAGLAHVVPNRDAFLKRALAKVAELGRRRVAVLTTQTNLDLSQQQLPQRVAEWGAAVGLASKPYWTIPIWPHLAPGVRCTVRLLFDAAPEECPDALIIEDDHMVEAAAQGLAEAGINTEKTVTVIGYCNFPDRPVAAVPIIRLGLDCRDLLARLVATIDAQIHGQPVPPVTWTEPVFESEFTQRYAEDGTAQA